MSKFVPGPLRMFRLFVVTSPLPIAPAGKPLADAELEGGAIVGVGAATGVGAAAGVGLDDAACVVCAGAAAGDGAADGVDCDGWAGCAACVVDVGAGEVEGGVLGLVSVRTRYTLDT